jgi:diguanylate cyclase (GGDEF)-like protein
MAIILFLAIGTWLFTGLSAVKLETALVLTLHNVLEMFSVILGFIIFFIAWYSTNQNKSLQVVVISLVVLSASIFDFIHVISFPGMPGFNHPILADVWITCSVLARLIAAGGLLFSIHLPQSNHYPASPYTILSTTLLLVAGLAANIFINHNSAIWGIKIQHLAVYLRLLVVVVDLVTLYVLYRFVAHNISSKMLFYAILAATLTDASFALVVTTEPILNVSGHFFKIISYYYILRTLFNLVISKPYNEIIKLKEEMESLARKNAALYEASEKQCNLIEDTLAKIGMIISTQLNLNDTFDAIADMVADMMHARQSAIALQTKGQTALQVVATYGINTPPKLIPLDSSLAGRVLETGGALYAEDLAIHPEIFRPQLIFTSIRSMVCAPLVNDNQIIGVIEAYSSEKGAFSERDALLLKVLGHHAGAAIASAMLYQETKLRLEEEKFLYQITQAAASTIDPDMIIEQGTTYTIDALKADVGVGLLAINQGASLQVKTCSGVNLEPISFAVDAYPDLARVIGTLRPAAMAPEVFPPLAGQCDQPLHRLLIMPLTIDHSLLGLIIIGWLHFIPNERLNNPSFIALLAQQVALGLEKAHLYNEVRSMALADGLTGLANRRNFDLFFAAELRRATSLKRPLSLIMLDLDKFKNYNDTYGHIIGDKLLTRIGEILHHSVRTIDLPARYGGEEFSVILPECSNTEALSIAEKLRVAIEKEAFPDNFGTLTARITASLGLATYDPLRTLSLPKVEYIIAAADRALYQAKQQGRNQVVNAAIIE